MRHEIIPRTFTILLHDDDDGVRPSSGVEVMRIGHIGLLFSLRGSGFYKRLALDGLECFRELGIDTVLTGISKKHYRAMRIWLKGAKVHRLGTLGIEGHEFELVSIRADYATSAPMFGEQA